MDASSQCVARFRHTGMMQSILESMKFSANIPDELLVFLDAQVKEGRYKSRSQAITEALQSWRTQKFADDYSKAFAEYDDSWDDALADGLAEDDTW